MLDVFSRKNACKVGPWMLRTLNTGQLLVEIGTFLGFIELRYTKLPGVKKRLAHASRDLLELLFYSQALSRRS